MTRAVDGAAAEVLAAMALVPFFLPLLETSPKTARDCRVMRPAVALERVTFGMATGSDFKSYERLACSLLLSWKIAVAFV